MGCTETDGLLIIGAHSHGQFVQPGFTGKGVEQGEMHRRLFIHGRDAHQPGYIQPQIITAIMTEADSLARGNPGLLVFLTGIDLDQAFDAAIKVMGSLYASAVGTTHCAWCTRQCSSWQA